MKILQLTTHFKPNIGGVETHLNDLVNALIKRNSIVTVLTYRPLTTKVKWKIYESENGASIIRIPWLANLFYKLIPFPAFEFLYLFPGLLMVTPVVLLVKKPEVIHGHGLVAGFVSVFWGKILGKRTVISTHSIYNFSEQGFYRKFAGWIFKNADVCLGLSKQAGAEILSLGADKNKVKTFTYWIDLNKFKAQGSKLKVKKKLRWNDKFIVLFVGRLVQEKGIEQLLESVKSWDHNINLVIIGSGPLESKIKKASVRNKDIKFMGSVSQDNLPTYYSGADVLIVPSTSEEGFGRVILEALACNLPVIGANRGAISEAINESVGRLIDVNPKNIKEAVEHFYNSRDELSSLSKNCRQFAERRYSERNVETILRAYSD